MRRRLWLAIFWTLPAGGAANPYIGAEACRTCHPAQFAGQTQSGHARALYRAPEHPLAERFATQEPVILPPNFHFSLLASERSLRVRADDGKYVTELPLEWAFGAGVHAVTFVSKVNDQFYLEHSLSYFKDTDSLDLTSGHERLSRSTLHQAMGQTLKLEGGGPTIVNCFQCHSTGPVSISAKSEIRITEAGVRCEGCHGAGGAHRDAAALGHRNRARTLIDNPKRLSATQINSLCGTCHRSLSPDFNWNSAWNVRHQPPFLARSRCFRSSAGALTCITCHNPHQSVRRDAEYYNSKCVACHKAGATSAKEICGAGNVAGCTGCHMPLVTGGAHLQFRNHWIGVYRGGESIRPVDSAGQLP